MFFVKSKIIYRGRWYENLVHTGQHYDYEMSQAFFEDLAVKLTSFGKCLIVVAVPLEGCEEFLQKREEHFHMEE